eukprot:scaffold134539_cov24-Tisochrysis_lutea.AAC.1
MGCPPSTIPVEHGWHQGETNECCMGAMSTCDSTGLPFQHGTRVWAIEFLRCMGGVRAADEWCVGAMSAMSMRGGAEEAQPMAWQTSIPRQRRRVSEYHGISVPCLSVSVAQAAARLNLPFSAFLCKPGGVRDLAKVKV